MPWDNSQKNFVTYHSLFFHFCPSRHLSLAFCCSSWQLILFLSIHYLLSKTSGFTLTVLLSLINVYWSGSGQSEDDALCFLLLFLCLECFFTFFECFFASWHKHYATWETHFHYSMIGVYDASSSCSSCGDGLRSGCSFAHGLLSYEKTYPCSGDSCVRNVPPYHIRSRFNSWMVIYRTLLCAFWHCPGVQLSSSSRTNLCCWVCVNHGLLVYSHTSVFSLFVLNKGKRIFVVIALLDDDRV